MSEHETEQPKKSAEQFMLDMLAQGLSGKLGAEGRIIAREVIHHYSKMMRALVFHVDQCHPLDPELEQATIGFMETEVEMRKLVASMKEPNHAN